MARMKMADADRWQMADGMADGRAQGGGPESVRAKQTRNPITCSGAASARVLLVRAHLLVAYCN
jgi:hypothetical protein